MLHLLPEQQKKKIIAEYVKRLGIVWCLFIIGIFVSGVVLLIPSYIITSSRFYKVDSEKQQVENQLNNVSGDNSAGTMTLVSNKIAILSPLGAKENASDVFEKFNNLMIDGVKIKHYGYLLNSDSSITLDIEGVADNRDVLLAFADTIEDSGFFTGAEVPLSSLRSDQSIPFNFKLKVKPPEVEAASSTTP